MIKLININPKLYEYAPLNFKKDEDIIYLMLR